MIRQGIVNVIDDVDHYQVQLEPISGCGTCASKNGCGVQLLPTNPSPIILKAVADSSTIRAMALSVGDKVHVRVAEPDSGWLRIVFMAYGLPTMGMLAGALAGYTVTMWANFPAFAELGSVAGFIAGLSGGLIAWDRVEKSTRDEGVRQPIVDTAIIVGVVGNSGEVI